MKVRSVFNGIERRDIVEKSQQCLWTDEGSVGLDYLLKQRGLSEKVIKDFGLGYIPNRITHQLAGRIIFPIIDPSGQLIAISSRQVGDENEYKLPSYWHESYEKSFYLYGIQNAKQHMRDWKFATVVEGQLDVMQMHNYGIVNTVGILGTNLSQVQLSVIQRYCEEIIMILDKDENSSGQKGVQKAMMLFGSPVQQALSTYRNKLSFVELNEFSDPDSYLRKHGGEPIKKMIKSKLDELRKNFYDTKCG